MLRIVCDPDGRILGRAAICGEGAFSYYGAPGVITVGGIRAEGLVGVAGIMQGTTRKATRDEATLLADSACLAAWASDQASLISESGSQNLWFSYWVLAYGGDPGNLPLAMKRGELLNYEAIVNWHNIPDAVGVMGNLVFNPGTRLAEDSAEWLVVYRSIHASSGGYFRRPEELVREALAKAWGCPSGEIKVYKRAGGQEVEVAASELFISWDPLILRKPRS